MDRYPGHASLKIDNYQFTQYKSFEFLKKFISLPVHTCTLEQTNVSIFAQRYRLRQVPIQLF